MVLATTPCVLVVITPELAARSVPGRDDQGDPAPPVDGATAAQAGDAGDNRWLTAVPVRETVLLCVIER